MTTCRFNCCRAEGFSWRFISMKIFSIALLAALCFTTSLHAQALTGAATRWNDSFSEWVIYSADGEGELRLRWPSQDDWTEWQYRLDESTGTLKLKWRGDLNEWEARGDNQIATARTVWRDNFREWRITDGKHTLTLRSRYGNTWDEWTARTSSAGHFEMYTGFEGDPRDWVIVDELDESVPLVMKLLMTHVVLFQSSPKQ